MQKKQNLFRYLLVLIVLTGLLVVLSVTAMAEDWYSSGSGSESDPYIIETAEQLENFAAYVNSGKSCYSYYFKLGDSFDNSDAPLTTAIGTASPYFSGNFDGNGRTVTLSLNGGNSDRVGLFAILEENGTVTHVSTKGSVSGNVAGGVVGQNKGTVTDCHSSCSVTGSNYAGGVVGWNYKGKLRNSSATGTVTGETGFSIGGVVGYNNSSSSIANCYATGTVTGGTGSYAGGVVGYNLSGCTVRNCYASGDVSGQYKGSLVGSNAGTVVNCYGKYGQDLIGQTGSGTVTDCYILPITQMQGNPGETDGSSWVAITVGTAVSGKKMALVDALSAGRTEDGTVWVQYTNQNGGYPAFLTPDTGWYENASSGVGDSEENPYIIGNVLQLEGLAELVNSGKISKKYFRLSSEYNDKNALTTPIGNDTNPFLGIFDGNGKTVMLNICGRNSDDAQGYFGMFGCMGNHQYAGTVKNAVVDGTVTVVMHKSTTEAGVAVGGVVGNASYGTVTDCSSMVTVTVCYADGTTDTNCSCPVYAGGVVGSSSAPITDCSFAGSISASGANAYVGGVTGCSFYSITNCYVTGTVTASGANACVGGVSGYSFGRITNCYGTGTVTASGAGAYAGGVVGGNTGIMINCYGTGTVTASGAGAYAGGVSGSNADSMTNCYAAGTVVGATAGCVTGWNNGKITNCYGRSQDGATNPNGNNGTGKTVDCYALPASQMTGAAGDVNGTDWVAITVGTAVSAQKIALADALNAYVTENPEVTLPNEEKQTLYFWVVDAATDTPANSGYPAFGCLITLDWRLGDSEITEMSVMLGHSVELPESGEWSDYTFGGWYTGIDGTGDRVTSRTVWQYSTVCYARWTKNGSTVITQALDFSKETVQKAYAAGQNGVQFTGAGTAESPYVLTLTNAVIDCSGTGSSASEEAAKGLAVNLPSQQTTIILNGTNTILAPAQTYSAALYACKTIEIQGPGTLNARGGKGVMSYGICCEETITITDKAVVNATGETTEPGQNSTSMGIYGGTLCITGSARVTAAAGDATQYSIGIISDNEITIENATVTATAGTVNGTTQSISVGICGNAVGKSAIQIKNAVVKTSAGTAATGTGNGSYGFYTADNLIITGSDVTASAETQAVILANPNQSCFTAAGEVYCAAANADGSGCSTVAIAATESNLYPAVKDSKFLSIAVCPQWESVGTDGSFTLSDSYMRNAVVIAVRYDADGRFHSAALTSIPAGTVSGTATLPAGSGGTLRFFLVDAIGYVPLIGAAEPK